jgi:uncharacterized membrane protein (UPF0127 family)
MKRILPLLLILGVLTLAFAARVLHDKQKTPPAVSQSNVVKINNISIQVIPAKTQAEITRGLGGTQSLEEFEGMLFYLPPDTQTSFWMKDMLIPIDIIWINDGKITGIQKNVQPQPGDPEYKLELYPSPGGVDYVLEVNAGFSDKNNIKVGDGVII